MPEIQATGIPPKNYMFILMVDLVPIRSNQTFGTISLPRVIILILRQNQFSSPAPLKSDSHHDKAEILSFLARLFMH